MKKTTGMDRSITGKWRPATQAVRGGTWRSEQGETSEALFLTSGYSYDNAQTVADRFAGDDAGMTYSRLQNPTVAMLEERIALMEGAEACRAQASGMAAMTTALLCQLSAGDHVVGARAAFGSCRWLLDHLLPRFGIETTVVDSADNDAWEAAIRPNTKVFFFETPANPTLDVVDLAHVCAVARAHDITTVVDNAFATSALQRPMDYGADVVAYSATKLMDGQGRVLAGAVCGSHQWIDEVLLPFQRNTGPNISPFNAWVVHKGIETLDLRARRQSANAVALGAFIEPRLPRILHPGLASHPRHDLAMEQMVATGPIFALDVGDRATAFKLLDALQLVDISNNIGDSRSLMCHPASTTHAGMTQEARDAMGVTEGLLRINVGLEDVEDVKEDLDRALTAAGL
ncbi:trans-sulfuration enzyme family protein [Qipengyuania flava]|uniref:trans-sulfuration enzyme family protein n=1 Tax=Qipengyuania flava TaxID=192812 RepID=UPI001C5681DB|nr:aminotransferase class I/II-fold pyridoxal phosphate-dependent enzyme [Qipengyuania flava]MBW3168822.1 aminotransferase class I/II-fold pyridoxal phosphate-dependent enzyme [Qipengyuania flava]MBY5966060.1 aminotransferase class I/II-fold pyridoxal phosphate-dependent enzyme [Qipengyuania flava]MBY6012384.1 aminotransferase class I/II-fold pyridoxal phosphate-dependent enzyme [Qipengyuania flava]MBY6026826.1 aminotransferase class I/II-fold pyridoxal phosphate-dependent enzyme [Qipengyuania 